MGGGHGFIGGKAAVFDGATGIFAHFKLDGGVVDVKAIPQAMIDVGQNAAAF
jgi:hypothetical protein